MKIVTASDLRKLELLLAKANDAATKVAAVGRDLSAQIKRAAKAIEAYRQEELALAPARPHRAIKERS